MILCSFLIPLLYIDVALVKAEHSELVSLLELLAELLAELLRICLEAGFMTAVLNLFKMTSSNNGKNIRSEGFGGVVYFNDGESSFLISYSASCFSVIR